MPDPKVKVGLDVDGKKAGEELKKFGASAKKTGIAVKTSLIGPLLKTQAILGGLKLGFRAAKSALTSITTGFSASGDQIAKMSEKLGISVEQLSLLKGQAELSSISFETLSIGAKTLSKSMSDFQRGSGEAKVAFEEFGITIDDISGPKFRSTTAAMETLADKFKDLEDGPKKTALAMKVFGKAGTDLLPLLNQGSEALKEQAKEIEALGGVMTTQAAQDAVEFEDSLTKLNFAFDGMVRTIGSEVVPAITSMIEGFLKFFQKVREPLQIFLQIVPVLFSKTFERVKEIFTEGLDASIVQESLDKMFQLFEGFNQAFAVLALDLWEPLFDGLVSVGIKISQKVADILNESIKGFNTIRVRALSAIGELPAGLSDSLDANRAVLESSTQALKNLEAQQRQVNSAREAGLKVDEDFARSVQFKIEATKSGITEIQGIIADLEQEAGGIPEIVFPKELLKVAEDRGRSAAEGFSNAFETAIAAIKESANEGKPILEIITGLSDAEIAALINSKRNALRGAGKGLKEAFQEGVDEGSTTTDEPGPQASSGVANSFFGGFKEGFDEASKALTNFRDQGKAVARDLIGGIGSIFNQFLFKVLEEGFESTREALKSLASDILKFLAQLAIRQATANALGALTSSLGGAVTGPSVGAAEGGVFPGGVRPLGGVPGFAGGGIINQPMIAAIGENAPTQEEAVIPLSRNREVPVSIKRERGSDGAQRPVNVTFAISSTDSASFDQKLAERKSTIKNLIIEAINTDNNLKQQIRSA